MSDVVGLALRDGRVDCVVLRRALGTARVLHAVSVPTGDDPAAAIRATLAELRVRARRVHVGLPRRRVVVKTLELPPVAGLDLRRAVGFELERHLPFPAADAVFDYVVLAQAPGQPSRVLLIAAERRLFSEVAEIARGAGLVPVLVDVALHNLASLAARGAGARPGDARVVVHLEAAEAELAVVRRGQPLVSRAFALPTAGSERGRALGNELRRSLAGLAAEDRAAVADVTVTGPGPLPESEWASLPVHAGAPLPARGTTVDAAMVPALAMALRRPTRGPLQTSLMPEPLRPKPFPWPVAATAALAVLTLLLGLAIPAVTALRDERRLQALERALDELAPEVREIQGVARAVEGARRDAEALRGFERQHVRPLPVLRELTELLPADVWLTSLSVDSKGIEMAGFAAAASQLIPLLESSPTFEAAQFTSPVTKGRDREQFRLKAGWERSPSAPPATPGARPAPRRGPAPPADDEEG